MMTYLGILGYSGLKLFDDGMSGVDFEDPLPTHVCLLARIGERLRLHDSLHVRTPPIFRCHHHARGVCQTVAELHVVNVFTSKSAFPPFGQLLERLLELLQFRFLPEFEPLLGYILEFLVFIIHQVLHQVFIHGVGEENDLHSPGQIQCYETNKDRLERSLPRNLSFSDFQGMESSQAVPCLFR